MKRSVLIALVVVLSAGFAQAQPAGSVDIFSDAAMTDCNINMPAAPGIFSVYVAHTNFGASALQFAVDYTGLTNAGLMFLSETVTPPFLFIGTAATGISIAYGSCQGGAAMTVLTLSFFYQLVDPPDCTYLSILPDPNFVDNEGNAYPAIASVECVTGDFLFPTGGQAIAMPVPGQCECNTPVEESTWGGVKALYQ